MYITQQLHCNAKGPSTFQILFLTCKTSFNQKVQLCQLKKLRLERLSSLGPHSWCMAPFLLPCDERFGQSLQMTQTAQGNRGLGTGETPVLHSSLRCSHSMANCSLDFKWLTTRRGLKQERREDEKQDPERRKVMKKGKGRKKSTRK